MKYQKDICGFCGACVAVCPNKLLELTLNQLIFKEGCDNCGNCLVVCPLGAVTNEGTS